MRTIDQVDLREWIGPAVVIDIAVACAPDGTYCAVWNSDGQDGSGDVDFGVKAAILVSTSIFGDGFEPGNLVPWSDV